MCLFQLTGMQTNDFLERLVWNYSNCQRGHGRGAWRQEINCSAPPSLSALADTSLTSCGQISLSSLSGIPMYRSICLKYYSYIALQWYLENTGASAVCLLPEHPAAVGLIWHSYQGTSHTHRSPAALYADKGLLQVQSTSKTTGDTLPLRTVLPFGPCLSLKNRRKYGANLSDGAVIYNTETKAWLWMSSTAEWASHIVFMLCLCMVPV